MLRDVYGRPKLHLPEVKMSGSTGTITVGTMLQHTYEYKVECCDLIEGAAAGQEILEILRVVEEQAPSGKKAGTAFKSVDDTKEVPLDPESVDGQMVHIKANLPPKKCACQLPTHEKGHFRMETISHEGNPKGCHRALYVGQACAQTREST